MKDQNEKIVSAQTIAHDVISQISAAINQDNATKETMKTLKGRVEELSEMLDSIETDETEF